MNRNILIAVLIVIAAAVIIWAIIAWTGGDDEAELSLETPGGEVSVDVDSD